VWNGLPTFCQERNKEVANPCLNDEFELVELLPSRLGVKSDFALTDSRDPRYQKFQKIKERHGTVVLRAASALRQNEDGENHVDAILGVVRAIDSYLLEYGVTREAFESVQKSYLRAKRCEIMSNPPLLLTSKLVRKLYGPDSKRALDSFS
jgi:proteasome activator subunit 4